MARAKKQPSKASYRVFVSHASADKWLAHVIREKVEAVGATTFIDDRDIKGGDSIPEEIRRELAQSSELIVLLTPESVDRPWVLLEVGAFWGRSARRRISVMLCHIKHDRIPDMIREKKAWSLNDFDRYLDELRSRLKKATS